MNHRCMISGWEKDNTVDFHMGLQRFTAELPFYREPTLGDSLFYTTELNKYKYRRKGNSFMI